MRCQMCDREPVTVRGLKPLKQALEAGINYDLDVSTLARGKWVAGEAIRGLEGVQAGYLEPHWSTGPGASNGGCAGGGNEPNRQRSTNSRPR